MGTDDKYLFEVPKEVCKMQNHPVKTLIHSDCMTYISLLG